MRRKPSDRVPSPRRPLAFEPLEPRELLAADVGFDWSAYWDAVSNGDWSWAFDESWDVGGSDAAGTDPWWDASTDASDTGDYDSGTYDAGGFEWTAGDPVVDPAQTDAPAGAGDAPALELVSPPGEVSPPESSGVLTDEPKVSPEDAGATDGEGGLVGDATPAEVSQAPDDQAPDDQAPDDQVADDQVADAEGMTGEIVGTDVMGTDADSSGDGSGVGEDSPPITDAWSGVGSEWPFDEGPAFDLDRVPLIPLPDFETGDRPFDKPFVALQPGNELHDGLDTDAVTVEEPAPSLPSVDSDTSAAPTGDTADEVADAGIPTGDEVAAPVIVTPKAASDFLVSRFAGLGAFLWQGFGGQFATTDGSPSGAQLDGQPGTGRPRLRLPFRPMR